MDFCKLWILCWFLTYLLLDATASVGLGFSVCQLLPLRNSIKKFVMEFLHVRLCLLFSNSTLSTLDGISPFNKLSIPYLSQLLIGHLKSAAYLANWCQLLFGQLTSASHWPNSETSPTWGGKVWNLFKLFYIQGLNLHFFDAICDNLALEKRGTNLSNFCVFKGYFDLWKQTNEIKNLLQGYY